MDSVPHKIKTTLYQQGMQLLDDMIPLCEKLLNAQEPELEIDTYTSLSAGLSKLDSLVAQLKCRMLPKEPEGVPLYGPVMRAKVQALVDRFDKVYQAYQDEIEPIFEHVAARKKQSEEKQAISDRLEKEKEHRAQIDKGRQETVEQELLRQEVLKKKQAQKELEERQETDAQNDLANARSEAKQRRQLILSHVQDSERFAQNEGPEQHCNRGLSILASHCVSVASRRTALEPLVDVLKRIIEEPDNVLYRVIRVLNPEFYTRIASLPGSLYVLRAAGFQLRTYADAREEIDAVRLLKQISDPVNEEACRQQTSTVGSSGTHRPDELYLVLSEPDPLKEFEAWSRWRERLAGVHKLLSESYRFLREGPQSVVRTG